MRDLQTNEFPDDMTIEDAIKKQFPDRKDKHKRWITILKESEEIETVRQLRQIDNQLFQNMRLSVALKSGLQQIRESKYKSIKEIDKKEDEESVQLFNQPPNYDILVKVELIFVDV